jgi:predicted Zn-dependent protease
VIAHEIAHVTHKRSSLSASALLKSVFSNNKLVIRRLFFIFMKWYTRQAFYFFVVLSDDINAFAGPGGVIGINSGLILNSESESELASVIAHEIAHVTQRHIYRAYEASSRMSLPAAAAMIAAIIVATQAPDVGIGALSAIQAGSIQMQIDFTRSNEQEAEL